MDRWFTTEQIDDDTFAISEYRHWEQTHCYLLIGRERALLIDSGLGVTNIREEAERLTALPVLLATTHVHWDHIGGHAQFQKIAVHPAEEPWLNGHFPLSLSAVQKMLTRLPCDLPKDFRIEDYRIFQGAPAALLHDGEEIALGGRTVTVLHTPGHSPGHCCFYERERGYLFSGDIAYEGCLDAYYPSTDPQAFRRSAERLAALAVRRLLPAHHRLEIAPSLLQEIAAALARLDEAGKLVHGAGLFAFAHFSLHL